MPMVRSRATSSRPFALLLSLILVALAACDSDGDRERQSLGAKGTTPPSGLPSKAGESGGATEPSSRNPGSEGKPATRPGEGIPNDQCPVETPRTEQGERILRVFFHCGDDTYGAHVVAVPRKVPDTPAVLTAALSELLKGPTPSESELGLHSPFDEDADALKRVEVVGAQARIDFSLAYLDIPNIGTTNLGGMAYEELNRTVFQFANIDSIVYSIGGDTETWCELYGIPCEAVSRDT